MYNVNIIVSRSEIDFDFFHGTVQTEGGYCTLGAALATERVGHGVSGDGTQPLMHGPTFMGSLFANSWL